MEIVKVPMSQLHEDPNNAREHNDRNIAEIVSCLKQYGLVEPLVVQKSTNMIIGGNGRLRAMQQLGWVAVEVNMLDVDDKTAARLGLALNRTSDLSTWNMDKLAETLRTLEDIPPGFSEAEIDAILTGAAGTLQGDGAVVGAVDALDLLDPPAADENVGPLNTCPKCGFQWAK